MYIGLVTDSREYGNMRNVHVQIPRALTLDCTFNIRVEMIPYEILKSTLFQLIIDIGTYLHYCIQQNPQNLIM